MNTQTETQTPADTASKVLFPATDRCDKCGAQAYVLVTLNAGDLLFCGHHYRAHRTILDKAALRVHNTADWIA